MSSLPKRQVSLQAYVRHEIGKWLRHHRQTQGLSIEQVSAVLKVYSVQEIEDIENGESPLMNRLSEFVKIYNIDAAETIQWFHRLNTKILDILEFKENN